ncbi:MAG: HNH endonuclease [Phycisphaerales bacterium]|nr:MAG: HNH endonuclease [Phycisphaerales bacterium]
MSERICANCACAVRPVGRWFRIILARWPGLLACISHPEAPGQMREVSHLETCRNFRRKYSPPGRREPPEPANDDIRYIALTKSGFAIVDAADFEWLNQYKWQATCNGTKFYATTKNRRAGNIWMHRLIMNAPKGMVVDHINGNGLDNRRCNLRICTRQQNAYNSRRSQGTSQYKGFHFEKATGAWRATITCQGEYYNLGLYDSEVEAARAYDRKAIELFGEYAYLNFPEEHGRQRREAATDPTLLDSPR